MKWFSRRPPVEVPLDPAQVHVMRFLMRVKAAPEDKLWQEVETTFLYLTRREFSQGLADLAARHIIEPRIQPEDETTWFVVGEMGRKLRGKLPRNVKSAIVIYL